MIYNDQYNTYLPEISDYSDILEFKDYEFTYCIAFEMAVRTDLYVELIKTKKENRDRLWKEKMYSLGMTEFDKCSLKDKNKGILLRQIKYDYKLSTKHWNSFYLDDLKQGTDILCTFYFNKKQLYKLKKINNVEKFIVVNTDEYSDALYFPNNYYIPCKSKTTDKKIKILKNLSLKVLENDFLSTLELSDLDEQIIDTEPIYSRPTLRFKQDKIVNLQVNLNLQEDELIAYISKVRKDYQNDKSIIMTQLEEFRDKEFDDPIKPKSNEKIPFNKKKKQAISEAFFIFDLYKQLTPIFDKKQREFDYDSYHKRTDLKIFIQEITGFSLNAIEVYHTYMRENIDLMGYKDLLLIDCNEKEHTKAILKILRGNKTKTNNQMQNKSSIKKRLTKEEKKAIINMNNQKIPYRKIALSLGKPPTTVQYHIKKEKERKNK